MIVCIAEKPSVARDIAKVIGANLSREGYMEGNGYQVTWTYGHLCTLKEPQDYRTDWKSWILGRLPMIPDRFGIKLIQNEGYAKQFAIIEQLMQAADGIVNCGDAGQEGELIQRWVMQKAQVKCPVQRLWISSLTEESIRDGFDHLRPQEDFQSLYEAGLCRAIGDWLLGMNATRLYTLKYRHSQGQVLSVGRVQTPTLALIVKRQQEIDSFVPEPYWVLATRYRDTLFTATQGKIRSESDAQQALQSIEKQAFTVTDVSQKKGSEAPPRLFDLTSLQVECNKKYAFSAEETLRYIQSLYEKKLTTYPRVDTTYLSDDIYGKCPSILQGLSPYAQLIEPLMGKKLRKSKKVFDSSKVTDHHAIIPTGVDPVSVYATREEKLVYHLVAQRFIACFYPDCVFSTTTVFGEVALADTDSKPIGFKATGKQILDSGWRDVFGGKNDVVEQSSSGDGESEQESLPDFKKGEQGSHTPTLTAKQTTPPESYTEATLLRAMETAGKGVEDPDLREALKANGIGRPSTRAAIIETLFKRNYIRKNRKRLLPTEEGVRLIGVIQDDLLKSAELTGRWEKKLRDIENHQYDAQQFMDEMKTMVSNLVAEVKTMNGV